MDDSRKRSSAPKPRAKPTHRSAPRNDREAEQTFRHLFANNPLPMWVYDRASLRFLEVNDAAVAKYGYSRDEFLAMSILDMRPPEDAQRVHEALGELPARFRNSGNWRHKLRDGRLIDVDITSHDIRFGGADARLVVLQDVTDRKLAEQARLMTQRIFETSQDLILVVDRRGKLIEVSPSSMMILGYERTEMVGRDAGDFLYPPDLDSTRERMREARRGVKTQFDTRYVHREGRIVTLSWTGIWSEPEQRHFFIGRDMSAQRRAEELSADNRRLEALHATEERFRLMVESVRDYAILTLDADGNVASWNAGAERLKGYAAAEILGRHFAIFYTEEDRLRDHPGQKLKQAVADGRYQEEGWRVRKDGSRFWASVTLTAVRGADGSVLGFTKVTRDMTEKREADEAIQHLNGELQQRLDDLAVTNQELEAFSYSVSHDLRAPLRAIDGFSRILQDDYAETLGEDGRHLVEVVRNNAQQMGRLIDDLLAFSRLGRQSLKLEPVELKSLIDIVIAELQGELTGRRIDFRLDELGVVQADPALLKQALVNLLSNAVKFTRNKDVAVIEIARRHDPEKGTVYHVKDNGAGFDMRYANKLFSVFQRLHRAEDYEGTGVGLAIVQRVIHRHGGRVWAAAKPGEGAAFYFTLREPGDDAVA